MVETSNNYTVFNATYYMSLELYVPLFLLTLIFFFFFFFFFFVESVKRDAVPSRLELLTEVLQLMASSLEWLFGQ